PPHRRFHFVRVHPLGDAVRAHGGCGHPGGVFGGGDEVVDGGAFVPGDVVAEVPEGVAVEHEVAGVEVGLEGAGQAADVVEAAALQRFGGRGAFEVGAGDGAVGEAAGLGREVAAEVAAGDDPEAGVFVEGAVDLVEEVD